MIKRLLLPLWILAAGALTLYSFTQVSLSLTLTQLSVWQSIQQAFQYVGYFNRPLSASLYISVIILFFILYGFTLYAIRKKLLTVKKVAIIVLSVSTILFVAYNAFSFDIFNYIFDAKIVTAYGQNPYNHKALDFPEDPMLSFMQWTHRTYPYGPAWLAITIPVSYVGMQYFLVTFYLFKLLAVASFVGTAWLIYKIVHIQKKEQALFAAAFFALNPLLLIEFLVSGHNDIVMIFLAALGMYLLVQKKYAVSIVLFIFSTAVKYATGFLAPMVLYLLARPKQWERAVIIGIASMILAVVAATQSSGNFQPWYLSYVLFVVAFIAYKKYVLFPLVFLSFFACFHYVPYLYTGTWDPPISSILSTGLLASSIFSTIVFVYYLFMHFRKRSKV